MKKIVFITIIFVIAVTSSTFSQSLYIEKDNNATALAVEYQRADDEGLIVGSMSMSGKGIVDFGVFYGRFSDGYTLGTGMELFALKQSESIPLTITVRTDFFLVSQTYDYYWSIAFV